VTANGYPPADGVPQPAGAAPPAVLIIEDSRTLAHMANRAIQERLGFVTRVAGTFAEVRRQLAEPPVGGFLAALVDLNLPDAPRGEVLDYVVAAGVPAIVLTANYSTERRQEILKRRVVDYLIKQNRHTYDYVVRLLRRLDRNRAIEVLVVDDSRTVRGTIAALLKLHNYQVLTAADGREALAVLASHPQVALVLTDYHMPEMDGFELITAIRQRFERPNLSIIGLSAQGAADISARFLKQGANDFLAKPFSPEELYCRVMQAVETAEYIQAIEEAAFRDPLTGLHNRRHFFNHAASRIALHPERVALVAMLDIDHFKRINDTYGHDGGDAALVAVANSIKRHFGGELAARFGGEEFCILFQHDRPPQARVRLDNFRQELAATAIPFGNGAIACTVSCGLAWGQLLEPAIKAADEALYRAKAAGRNRIEPVALA